VKSVVESDEEQYSEVEEVAASDDEMQHADESAHDQSMMALDEEYDEPALEHSAGTCWMWLASSARVTDAR
jgi:hypothetical protein